MGAFSSPQSGHRKTTTTYTCERHRSRFVLYVSEYHRNIQGLTGNIRVDRRPDELFMRRDLHWDYSTTSARHCAIENPISVLSIERDTSRGINHANGDNGKSFVRGARCTSERSHWLDMSIRREATIADAVTMNHVNANVKVASRWRVKKITLTIGIRSYMTDLLITMLQPQGLSNLEIAA